MAAITHIQTYFKGERNENAALMGIALLAGVGCAVINAYFLNNELLRGLLWPLLALAIIGLLTGGFNFTRNVHRLKVLPGKYTANPLHYLNSEKERMNKLKKLHLPFIIFWTALIATGVFMLMQHAALIRGIGIGLIIWGIIGHIIDLFAEKRNRWYRATLTS